MSKLTLLTIAVLMIGLVLASLTFFISTNGHLSSCGPSGTGPLAELAVQPQKVHGYPFSYYLESVNDVCGINEPPLKNGLIPAEFVLSNFLADILVFGAITSVVATYITRNKR